jgi:hypothetical protein
METKYEMIDRAFRHYGDIRIIVNRADFWTSFTEEQNKKIFWFNTPDGSTRLVLEGQPIQ